MSHLKQFWVVMERVFNYLQMCSQSSFIDKFARIVCTCLSGFAMHTSVHPPFLNSRVNNDIRISFRMCPIFSIFHITFLRYTNMEWFVLMLSIVHMHHYKDEQYLTIAFEDSGIHKILHFSLGIPHN